MATTEDRNTNTRATRSPIYYPRIGARTACRPRRTDSLRAGKVLPEIAQRNRFFTEGGAGYLAWAPDGSRIATVNGSDVPALKLRAFIFDPNRAWKEQSPELLPSLDPPSSRFLVNDWSRDGKRLVGAAEPPIGGLVTYSVETHQYERLTEFGEWPVWLPDSRRVLFVANGKNFYIVDSSSKQVRKVFSVDCDIIGPPQLTRDGKVAYFSRRVTESDIWLVTLD